MLDVSLEGLEVWTYATRPKLKMNTLTTNFIQSRRPDVVFENKDLRGAFIILH